ncbi:hypothetical protein PTTG_25433 [Puccinia triticina 1-1 BBBD Race 1]|uniref:Retrotransposon gag domain-containing protein n=1 Tax=Puccinia triticina (isolate 1-1 / race 1 (BBBD)) TaxID=630390 RepID=A0A180H325_PUCT1|nr:hypothetical protein PTTG_25433 [Puccinia triticina 1-1 BBBD Race 1]
MSTQRTISSDQLILITDPEEILRRARAEQRRAHQLAAVSQQALSTNNPPSANSVNGATELDPLGHRATNGIFVGSAPAALPSGLHSSHTLYPPSPAVPELPDERPSAPELTGDQKFPGGTVDEMDPPPNPHTGNPPTDAKPSETDNHTGAGPSPTPNDPPPPPAASNNLSTRDCMKMLMSSQQASISQAHADRIEYAARLSRAEESNAGRAARLEDAFATLLENLALTSQPTSRPSDRVDHRKLNTSDAPKYTGPYMEIEPFLLWINGVEIFFTAKEITKDKDKILIVGRLISETNLLSFYQSQATSLLGKSWTVAKEELFDAALPSQWLTILERQIRNLKMGESETFAQYTTRARTLQRMINFNGESLTDYKLAEGMTFGLPPELEHEVNKLDLLKQSDFKFKEFVRRTGNCYDALPKKITRPRLGAPATTSQHSPSINNVPREEYIWRIHSYLDSIGKCHHCKQYCGHAARTCPGPVYRGPVEVPPNFIVPPKPSDYVAPRAWTKAQAAGSKTGALQPGRATGRPAGVAGVAEDANTPIETPALLDEEFDFDEYHAAAISTLTDIEAYLANETVTRASTAAATVQTMGPVAEILAMERLIFENGEDLVASFPNFNRTILEGVEGEFPSDNSDTEGSENQA